jgi:hypothetical protein
MALVEKDLYPVQIHKVYPLSEAAQAHVDLESMDFG